MWKDKMLKALNHSTVNKQRMDNMVTLWDSYCDNVLIDETGDWYCYSNDLDTLLNIVFCDEEDNPEAYDNPREWLAKFPETYKQSDPYMYMRDGVPYSFYSKYSDYFPIDMDALAEYAGNLDADYFAELGITDKELINFRDTETWTRREAEKKLEDLYKNGRTPTEDELRDSYIDIFNAYIEDDLRNAYYLHWIRWEGDASKNWFEEFGLKKADIDVKGKSCEDISIASWRRTAVYLDRIYADYEEKHGNEEDGLI